MAWEWIAEMAALHWSGLLCRPHVLVKARCSCPLAYRLDGSDGYADAAAAAIIAVASADSAYWRRIGRNSLPTSYWETAPGARLQRCLRSATLRCCSSCAALQDRITRPASDSGRRLVWPWL